MFMSWKQNKSVWFIGLYVKTTSIPNILCIYNLFFVAYNIFIHTQVINTSSNNACSGKSKSSKMSH